MGLFSTLTSTTMMSSDGQAKLMKSPQTSPSSATIPTLVQLYAGDVNNSSNNINGVNQQLILMENTLQVTGYTTLTYQAVQAGASSRDDAVEVKNRHSNPDLGVWNCRVLVPAQNKNEKGMNNGGKQKSTPLIDHILTKVASQTSVYCLTVDISDETSVEPNLSALQAALVRHLIERPSSAINATTIETNDAFIDGEITIDNPATDDGKNIIKTTSLYDLQTAQFGLASGEKAAKQTIEESAKDVKFGLMICAVVASSRDDGTNPNSNNKALTADLSSESAYKKKQAQALVVYHLRKFSHAINAALCFVERPGNESLSSSKGENNIESVSQSAHGAVVGSNDDTTTTTNTDDTQIAISYDKLSQLWHDMAMGVPVWEQKSESEDAATALYGPRRQQEDLIESVLLRNANYPGHWDASKDSLWVALPATNGASDTTSTQTETTTTTAGDDGWLTQLRDSIASALPATDKASVNEKTSADDNANGKPKEKDAAVSSFFESLLKNP
mmetsp:Transcript_44504/g.50391  ORF Transcript_44504/g.50391 Transcript_44504/m.50391 type:complete len:503 (-) Transcript_44504:27-1535(-)